MDTRKYILDACKKLKELAESGSDTTVERLAEYIDAIPDYVREDRGPKNNCEARKSHVMSSSGHCIHCNHYIKEYDMYTEE
tara:strand:+ start:2132 stop:2374 length:243 start_codon:yes stop_codon:yes gene_type:complete